METIQDFYYETQLSNYFSVCVCGKLLGYVKNGICNICLTSNWSYFKEKKTDIIILMFLDLEFQRGIRNDVIEENEHKCCDEINGESFKNKMDLKRTGNHRKNSK